MSEPKLQPPGAGIPFFENFFLRYIAMPLLQYRYSWDDTQRLFHQETILIASLYGKLTQDQRTQRVLIKRLAGLEDSSRNWSADMTLEHIMIVTKGMAQIVMNLADETKPDFAVNTAHVKPQGGHADSLADAFIALSEKYAALMDGIANRSSHATHAHPWFGEMNSHGWHTLMAVHHKIHRRQLKEIVKGLGIIS